jgi:hypothetical protein
MANMKKSTRKLTPAQKAKVQRYRRQIDRELPSLIASDQARKEAADETTLSGELRRAIHASSLGLTEIATVARIPPIALDEFLVGERTLRSDVLDRLATTLGLALTSRA